MYYIYHIPGSKIGVTRDLEHRVTNVQGYKLGEYEVLDRSEDIDYISSKEIELQKAYGYKIDRQTYKDLIKMNKMNINVTKQTTTFPVPVSELLGFLEKNVGLQWETPQGWEFDLNLNTLTWIAANAKTSMYNDERCYIYNKAFKEEFYETEGIYSKIRLWATERGIYDKGDSKTQYIKLMEEAGELAKALLNSDEPEIKDAIGDMVVVLTNLAHLSGMTIEDCVESAYQVIAKRKGKMINGTFVKENL